MFTKKNGKFQKIVLIALLFVLSFPVVSAASDCILVKDMAVNLLRLENSKVHVSWNAEVTNKCREMVSLMVNLDMNDRLGDSLNSSRYSVKYLLPNESRRIKKEVALLPEIYTKIRVYQFEVSVEKLYVENDSSNKIRF